MDENDYSIDSLEKIFSKHAKEFEKGHEKSIIKFTQDYPNEKLPDHLKNHFNLSKALLEMVKEIKLINRYIGKPL